MASGNTGAGFGRGGRGAALLQALAEITHKPGLGQGPAVETQALPEASAPVLPLGRGQLLASLRQNIENESRSSSSVSTVGASEGAGSLSIKPMGRGLAAMKSLLAQHQPTSPQLGQQPSPRQLPSPSQSQQQISRQLSSTFGRGFHLATGDQQEFKQLPTSRAEPSTDPPVTEAMSELRLDDKRPQEVRLPTITRIGTDGTPLRVSANHVKILCKHEGVYQYHVTFSPAVDNKKLRARLLAEHRSQLKTVSSFDGSILYLPFQLPDNETFLTSVRKTDGVTITIKISFVKVVPPEQCSHLYNILFRRIMYILQMCQVGRYYYNPNTPATVPQHKLEVWPGYVTAIREHEGGVLLLLDASHRVLRTETVLDIMECVASTNPQRLQEEIIRRIVGSIVLTRYNNKTYRVDDIIWNKSPLDRFECKATGKSMSFEDYYKKQHNIEIQNKTQPLLLHKRKPPKGTPSGIKPEPEYLCLIPELCYMSGLTDDIRQQFTVMKDLSVHTRVSPAQRQSAMNKFIDSVNNSAEAQAELATWGLEMDKSTITIPGRMLPSETIRMAKKEFTPGPDADFSREVTRNELISPVNLITWGLFYTRKDAPRANEFVRTLQAETRNLGILCHAPFRRELANEKIETLVQELRSSIHDKVQLVVIINPTNRDDRYAAIKKVCCVEMPVPSQVIISRTISKPDKVRSVVQKIALQINCKLGGELWAVKIPFPKLMVVGIDSYHDVHGAKRSIGGFVASMNRDCTRWYSNVCVQRTGQELVHGLQICLTNALRKFHSVNHFLPDRIVIYRDGVGDGQLSVLADHEVKQLQRCFSSFGDYTPMCATLCIQKRINTRIFIQDKDGKMINPNPGTIVDHTITRRDRYDFFIVSQHVRQGTVSPTHYIVVEDGLGITPSQMQRLTYKMTHLYYNWPGTIRVPAPCQYAHKLAYLVGESIHREPAECLSDRLFFL